MVIQFVVGHHIMHVYDADTVIGIRLAESAKAAGPAKGTGRAVMISRAAAQQRADTIPIAVAGFVRIGTVSGRDRKSVV